VQTDKSHFSCANWPKVSLPEYQATTIWQVQLILSDLCTQDYHISIESSVVERSQFNLKRVRSPENPPWQLKGDCDVTTD